MNKSAYRPSALASAILALSCGIAASQFVQPGAGPEMMTNVAAGETTAALPNYWDGVDAENDLHVNTATTLVLDDIGRMAETPTPSYPNFADMNGDGLNDLVVGDTQGFVWIYKNYGEKGKPMFTTGVFLPTFIGWGSKINVCDWDADGDNDIIAGTFFGDVVVLQNFGNKNDWRFTRKMGVPRYMDPQFNVEDPQDRLPQIMMGKRPMVKGNYMAPWVCDWNRDGKLDLLLGEGTYSANSIRLFVNTGSRNKPVFSEEREFYLAYGEGYEQLTPCVVDYNGDGLEDLLVGTRTGQIRLHKGTKQAIEGKDLVAAMQGTLSPAILEFDGFLSIAGTNVFDKMSNIFPCDWNEDGLFDLLMGSTKGKILIALNKGSKTNPEFPSVEPVKGTDTEKDLLAPAGWFNGIARVFWQNFLGGYCNTASLLTLEKEVALKPGLPPVRPIEGNYMLFYRYVHGYPGWTRNNLAYVGSINASDAIEHVIGGRFFSPNQTFDLRLGKKYELSFSSLLEGKAAQWKFWSTETVSPGSDTSPPKYENRQVSGVIPPSSTWGKRSFKFKCPSTVQSNLSYNFFFRMPEGECKFLVDGLSLKEAAD